jgi:hypothetical protein
MSVVTVAKLLSLQAFRRVLASICRQVGKYKRDGESFLKELLLAGPGSLSTFVQARSPPRKLEPGDFQVTNLFAQKKPGVSPRNGPVKRNTLTVMRLRVF